MFLLRSTASPHVVAGINVTSLKSSKMVPNVLWCEPAENVANDKQWSGIKMEIFFHKAEDSLLNSMWSCVHVCICVFVCPHHVCVSQVGMYHDPHGGDEGSSKENRMIFTESMPRRVGSFYRGKETGSADDKVCLTSEKSNFRQVCLCSTVQQQCNWKDLKQNETQTR